jgi:hypothetical protein
MAIDEDTGFERSGEAHEIAIQTVGRAIDQVLAAGLGGGKPIENNRARGRQKKIDMGIRALATLDNWIAANEIAQIESPTGPLPTAARA